MDYIAPPLVTEPEDLSDIAFSYLEEQVDGWLPSPGNLETWLVESIAQLAGELMDVASAVPTSIFAYFGASILGLPPDAAVSAMGLTTWTVRDDLGYTIPAGTTVGVPAAGDVLLGFEVAIDAEIPAGETHVTGVTVIAQDAGTEGNGLTSPPELIDALDFVTGVTLEGPTSGGVDAETTDEYLNRLRELATLLTPRPILPNDFAVLAREVDGVERSTAIDLYNADTGQSNVPRCVTVVVADGQGEPLTPAKRQEVDDYLQAQREVNFLVFVIDPTYTTVAVDFTIKVYPDFATRPDSTQPVVDAAIAAVTDYLSPAYFGASPYSDTPTWVSDTKVRYLEVAEAINGVEGVWYIETLTLNGGTVDIPLDPIGGLPRPGAITGAAL